MWTIIVINCINCVFISVFRFYRLKCVTSVSSCQEHRLEERAVAIVLFATNVYSIWLTKESWTCSSEYEFWWWRDIQNGSYVCSKESKNGISSLNISRYWKICSLESRFITLESRIIIYIYTWRSPFLKIHLAYFRVVFRRNALAVLKTYSAHELSVLVVNFDTQPKYEVVLIFNN